MATIKSYTDISQSKTLSKILPIESADMFYREISFGFYDLVTHLPNKTFFPYPKSIPAWSLSALLNAIPNGIVMNKDSQNGKYHFSSKYIGTYVTADNPIDACVAMIEKLNELKIL